MSIWRYSKHLIGDEWEQILMTVPKRISSFSFINAPNHRLVNEHKAYWQNDNTLCLGYRLINNHAIFRPIFNYRRQLQLIYFQSNIKRVVELRKEKRAFVELFKIKRIPKALVIKIIDLAY
jgi:hypothetical protein